MNTKICSASACRFRLRYVTARQAVCSPRTPGLTTCPPKPMLIKSVIVSPFDREPVPMTSAIIFRTAFSDLHWQGSRTLYRAIRQSGAASMVQVDELVGLRDMADDVEFANGFQLRGPEGRPGGRIDFAIERIFCPLPDRSQVFERVVVFDKYIQEDSLTHFHAQPRQIVKKVTNCAKAQGNDQINPSSLLQMRIASADLGYPRRLASSKQTKASS
jgi:hypothetical protein